jgi:hypothetical protein
MDPRPFLVVVPPLTSTLEILRDQEAASLVYVWPGASRLAEMPLGDVA